MRAGGIVPGVSRQSLSRLAISIMPLQRFHDLVCVLAKQIGMLKEESHAECVQMIVIESWQHRQTAGVHSDSVRPSRAQDRLVVPQRYYSLALPGEGSGPGSCGIECDD